jgi:hypothetical protein
VVRVTGTTGSAAVANMADDSDLGAVVGEGLHDEARGSGL